MYIISDICDIIEENGMISKIHESISRLNKRMKVMILLPVYIYMYTKCVYMYKTVRKPNVFPGRYIYKLRLKKGKGLITYTVCNLYSMSRKKCHSNYF